MTILFPYIQDHFKFTYIHDHFKFTYIQDHLKFTYIQDHLKFTYIQDHFLVVPLGTSLASYLACCGYFRFRHSRNIYCLFTSGLFTSGLFTSGLDILEHSIVYPLDGVVIRTHKVMTSYTQSDDVIHTTKIRIPVFFLIYKTN